MDKPKGTTRMSNIPKGTLVLLCVLAFVVGAGGYTGFHFATASERPTEEAQEDSDSKQQDKVDDDPERIIILEREVPSSQDSETPSPANNSDEDDYVLSDSATRQYGAAELERLDNYQLYLARNEIYARHGRSFRNDDLNHYFGQKSWYNPIYAPDEFDALDARAQILNDNERHNADLMFEIEQSRNSPYLN